MDARSEIMARIKRATVDVVEADPAVDVPVTWTYGTGISMDDVVGTFVEKVTDYQATVARCAPDAIGTAIVDGLRATGTASSVVVPPGLDEGWRTAITEAGYELRVDDPPLAHDALDGTDAVVTAAASAIADTGSIVLTHGADQGRRAISLVPDRHVCVVRASQVVSDVPESVQVVKPAVVAGSPLTFISGGSATSDIELSRVDGVHGPRQLYVVLVDDLS